MKRKDTRKVCVVRGWAQGKGIKRSWSKNRRGEKKVREEWGNVLSRQKRSAANPRPIAREKEKRKHRVGK